MITKGTMVTITTSNGGELTARLIQNHYMTYDAVVEVTGGYAVIPSFRIKTIVVVQ
jgi:hypothetical protein